MAIRAGPWGVVYGEGGAEGLNRAAENSSGGRVREVVEPPLFGRGPEDSPDFLKFHGSENAFHASLKPIFSIFYNLNFK